MRDKFQLLTSSKTVIDIHISDDIVSNQKRVKLLGINHEVRLDFNFYRDTLIKKFQ